MTVPTDGYSPPPIQADASSVTGQPGSGQTHGSAVTGSRAASNRVPHTGHVAPARTCATSMPGRMLARLPAGISPRGEPRAETDLTPGGDARRRRLRDDRVGGSEPGQTALSQSPSVFPSGSSK